MKETAATIFQSIISGDRVMLARAMTLVESVRPADRASAVELLEMCDNTLQKTDPSIRLTISGPPGVGKSTLLEALGKKVIGGGHKLGILTIDPTSNISQGSILGDKARMPGLSSTPEAFIRPGPAGAVLGGIGRRTMELMTLLATAGYNWIFLETVGVGQSEHIAWRLTDGFILVIQPGSGDELQGIKRGITELADVIVINKADVEQKESAAITRGHYQNAIHYFSPHREEWQTKVTETSALEGRGIDELWEILRLYRESRQKTGLEQIRIDQNKYWLSWSLAQTAHQLLMDHPDVNQSLVNGLHNIEAKQGSKYAIELQIERKMRDLINH